MNRYPIDDVIGRELLKPESINVLYNPPRLMSRMRYNVNFLSEFNEVQIQNFPFRPIALPRLKCPIFPTSCS